MDELLKGLYANLSLTEGEYGGYIRLSDLTTLPKNQWQNIANDAFKLGYLLYPKGKTQSSIAKINLRWIEYLKKQNLL